MGHSGVGGRDTRQHIVLSVRLCLSARTSKSVGMARNKAESVAVLLAGGLVRIVPRNVFKSSFVNSLTASMSYSKLTSSDCDITTSTFVMERERQAANVRTTRWSVVVLPFGMV